MRFVCLLSPLAAVVVALGACGGSEDETPSSTTRTEVSTTTQATATPERRELERELRRLLGDGDGTVDVDCAIEELRGTLSNETVEAATEAADRGEEIPSEAVDAAYEAGRECAAR